MAVDDSAVPSHDFSVRVFLIMGCLVQRLMRCQSQRHCKACNGVARWPKAIPVDEACKRAVADGTGGVRFTSAALEGSEMEWLQNKPRGCLPVKRACCLGGARHQPAAPLALNGLVSR